MTKYLVLSHNTVRFAPCVSMFISSLSPTIFHLSRHLISPSSTHMKCIVNIECIVCDRGVKVFNPYSCIQEGWTKCIALEQTNN